MAGIRAALRWRYGDDSLEGVRVAVQGVGSVGMKVAHSLHEAGAQLVVADPCGERVSEAVKKFSAEAVTPEDIHKVKCDLFVPCALGGTLSKQSVQELRCAVVAGSANNQLSSLAAGEALDKRGILYAPDYVINAGGVIAIAMPVIGLTPDERDAKIEGISDRLTQVFTRAEQAGIRPEEAADQLSEDILNAAEAGRIHSSSSKKEKRVRAHSGFSA
jgi:leucine dehydrogenase